ncbi:capsular polysaccharide biosynthesis protein [Rossellomorea sp. FM04394]|uniref:capsular polysaccharide export protein, LipB/KpsS family n=1 Tax=Rossellomorea sp. FM04394 TaxID=3243076 RepID=UPI0035A5E513
MKKLKKVIKTTIKPLYIIYKTIIFLVNDKKGESGKTVAYLFKISDWKSNYMDAFLNEYDIKIVPFHTNIRILKYSVEKYDRKVFIIWGFNEDPSIRDYAFKHNIPIYRLEDGFVRSKGLGSLHSPPYSISLDKKGMYFDSTQESDLEHLLNTFRFNEEPEIIDRARQAIDKLLHLRISKYNHVDKRNIEELYGIKTTKRILVIGQVEDDASIQKGSAIRWTNNDAVILARKENPDAEIIYKPHPDVLTGRRPLQSDPQEIKHLARVIEEPLSLVDSLETIDHVYTITSLSGFEALIRGIKVTTLGAPFYSGWGLTDDRQLVSRRKRTLSIEELFAGAYILYPRYADPHSKQKLSLEETIDIISNVG